MKILISVFVAGLLGFIIGEMGTVFEWSPWLTYPLAMAAGIGVGVSVND